MTRRKPALFTTATPHGGGTFEFKNGLLLVNIAIKVPPNYFGAMIAVDLAHAMEEVFEKNRWDRIAERNRVTGKPKKSARKPLRRRRAKA